MENEKVDMKIAKFEQMVKEIKKHLDDLNAFCQILLLEW